MAIPARPDLPHLLRERGLWVCFDDDDNKGTGISPVSAYKDMRRKKWHRMMEQLNPGWKTPGYSGNSTHVQKAKATTYSDVEARSGAFGSGLLVWLKSFLGRPVR